ncbi:hypothetical protein SAMN02787142_2100 [Burkholderia sp. WP9]|uniref:hypothetical protein n=1 Tax=Burkholderia sp. WP9 TaxID=1500263 RepID=UPI00089452F8|nr:hypothetical protein [Burkholderia sp. WP9]SEC87020.1 hypothetical protein SAMN02787142_2100 [Burkholderia sp. WP9]
MSINTATHGAVDLYGRAALETIESCTRWHVAVRVRGACIHAVAFQAWRPASRLSAKSAGEFFELVWRVQESCGSADSARVTAHAWCWTPADQWTAALPATSDAVRAEFVQRAIRMTADEVRDDHEDALREWALRLVAGDDVSSVAPVAQAEAPRCARTSLGLAASN